MYRFLGRLGIFSVFSLFIYLFLLIIWSFLPAEFHKNLPLKKYANMPISKMLKDLKSQTPVDVLFLGASHTYRGFDVRIFQQNGLSCFNLGTSSQTPIQTEILLKTYLHQLKPKLVIYEVYPECFTLDGLESTLDFLMYDHLNFGHAKMLLNSSNIKAYNLFSFMYVFQCFGISVPENQADNSMDHYITKGYTERDLEYYSPSLNPHTLQTWLFKPKQTNAFEACLTILKQKNIPFILIQAPYTSVLRESVENYRSFDQYFKKQGSYFNFNQILNLNDSLHFYDDDHLNQNGVKIFNYKLLELLQNQYFLNISNPIKKNA